MPVCDFCDSNQTVTLISVVPEQVAQFLEIAVEDLSLKLSHDKMIEVRACTNCTKKLLGQSSVQTSEDADRLQQSGEF
jgi:hypothetical protein